MCPQKEAIRVGFTPEIYSRNEAVRGVEEGPLLFSGKMGSELCLPGRGYLLREGTKKMWKVKICERDIPLRDEMLDNCVRFVLKYRFGLHCMIDVGPHPRACATDCLM